MRITMRNEGYELAANNVLRIKRVHANSPISIAVCCNHNQPVQEERDFILGCTESDDLENMNSFQTFRSASDFATVIGRNDGKKVRLWLYNNGSEATRAIDLTPNSGWDGPGSVGCDVLMGALHVIPRRRRVSDLIEERVDVSAAGAINLEDLIDEEIEVDYAAMAQSESSEE